MTGHRNISMPGSTPPRGYSDATLASPGGRLLMLGGHVAFNKQRELQHRGDLVGQLQQTLRNLKATLEAAGGTPCDLVKLTIHTPDLAAWHSRQKELGQVWRSILGPVYPALTLLGVAGLFDEGALVEIDGVAVLPAD